MWGEAIRSVPEATIVGAMDIDPQRRETFAAGHADVRLFASLDDALDSERYDAAILVTPPEGHREQAQRIFEAGLPLLAEKPLALDLADAAAIVRMAEEAGLPLSVCLNFRYLPVSQKKREFVRARACGELGM